MRSKPDNERMEELMRILKNLGIPDEERERIRKFYEHDLDGLLDYVLYMRAMLDDRHEYWMD